jgi:2-polyprenyl-6-methoxyphenol hydroxylase-like FAD-dependent oxidoreductase
MLPHLGQDANQSMEDSTALATILARADRIGAPRTLLAYEQFVANAPQKSSAARAQTGCATNPLARISASGTPR